MTAEDVQVLVAEAAPGSAWAFLDAVASRRVARAMEILDRLLETTPELVLLAQLHRRVRELVITADLLHSGARNQEVIKALGIKPYPAELRVAQARTWSQPSSTRRSTGWWSWMRPSWRPGLCLGDPQRRRRSVSGSLIAWRPRATG